MNACRAPWLVALSAVVVIVLVRQPAAAPLPADKMTPAIHDVLAANQPTVAVGGRPVDMQPVQAFYAERQYQPVWVADGAESARAQGLLQAFGEAGRDGLDPADYDLTASLRDAKTPEQFATAEVMLSAALIGYATDLRRGRAVPQKADQDVRVSPKPIDAATILADAVAAPDVYGYTRGLVRQDAVYGGLRKSLERYRSIAAAGGWPLLSDGPTLSIGSVDPRVETLRRRLQISGDFVSDSQSRAPNRFDQPLRQAVMRFQARHGLGTDGSVGPRTRAILNVPVEARIRQILVNLERARWLPDPLGDRYVLVNMAAYELEMVEDEQVALQMRVVIGRPARSTPMFSDQIRYLEFNPYWHVPKTILIEDKLPILRSNPAALTAQGIRVIAPGGSQIDPTTVNWSQVSANNFPYALRQDPGARNALGRVKFMFPNAYDIYLHDTPSRGLFKRSARALSSGCIRVEKPVELAEWLLRDKDGWGRPRIEQAIAAGRNRSVVLAQPVPVHLVYLTAWMDRDGTLEFRDDLYNRDARLVAALDGTRE